MHQAATVLLLAGIVLDIPALVCFIIVLHRSPRQTTGKIIILNQRFRVLMIFSTITLIIGSICCSLGFLLNG